MRLEKLIGRKVQWNKKEIAVIAEVYIHVEFTTLHGPSTPVPYAVVERPCGMLVLWKIENLTVLPNSD